MQIEVLKAGVGVTPARVVIKWADMKLVADHLKQGDAELARLGTIIALCLCEGRNVELLTR